MFDAASASVLLMVIINMRIKTNAGSVDKYGEFFFRGLFEQGDQVKERQEFLLDKWTAKNSRSSSTS